MTEEVYFKAKEAIECMLSDGVSIIEAIRIIDALYTETISTKDVPFREREMTEYKFGTWYPIEEFEHFEEDVLFWSGSTIDIGFRHTNSLKWATFRLRDDISKQVYPIKWMPLPPPPGETK